MPQCRSWLPMLACVLACVLAVGCSSADTAGMRGPGTRPLTGAAGTSSPKPGGGAAGDFGNSTSPPPSTPDTLPPEPPPAAPTGGARVPMSIDDCGASNPAGLSPDDAQKLMAGGAGGALRLLNPYDGTVFPRGILPPTLMWDGDSGTQYVYLHIHSRLFEYKGCLVPTAAGQLLLPEAVWTKAGEQTEGNIDPFRVELTVMGAGAVVGPVAETWTIAQATLKGSIYYNSYSSQLAGMAGFGGGSGAVLRIPRGKSAELFLGASGCTGCHSVSANGARMIALPLGGGPALAGASSSFELTPQGAANPAPLNAALNNGAFTGVAPDGTLFVTSAHGAGNLFAPGTGPRAGGPGAMGDPTAGLFETDTGTAVPNSGIAEGAMMTMFSPDATQIAFTDLAIADGHGLAVMSFDMMARTASGYRQVYATGDATRFPGWPFFLPDGKALVFAIGAANDFSGLGAGIGMGAAANAAGAPASDVYVVDLASGEPKLLAKAMGFATEQDATGGNTYLPFGAEELHHHYYPTVAPVAAGGYFWIFFDSLRHYGNQGMQRQIWGAAIDVTADGKYESDGSHPAFYLTGQEPATGNHRAFAALDPCQDDGESCTSGTDCCGGFCFVPERDDEFGTEALGTCSSEVPECAAINERCASTSDCCPAEPGQPTITCIAGYCAITQPVM